MSRSAYIWVVLGTGPVPLAAFTVKYELAAWLDRQAKGRAAFRIARFRHSFTSFEPVALDPVTLEPIPDQSEEGQSRG